MIRQKIRKLYETNPNVHMDVTLTRPKLVMFNAPAKITGVYSNIFEIEEGTSGLVKSHSLQYADVLIGRVTILEMK